MLFPRIAEAASTMPAPSPIQANSGSETILLVEDDPDVRAVTLRSLRSGGYGVLAACNGIEALELLANHRGRLELLVTDVVMPGPNGRQLAEAVRKEWPELRVLFVSGHSQEVLDHRGVLIEGIDLLPKPYTSASLLERVRKALDSN